MAKACLDWKDTTKYPIRARGVLAVCHLKKYHKKEPGTMYLDCFHIYVPAFMVGHLMHRLAGQNLDAALFQRRHDRPPGSSSGPSGQVQPPDPSPSGPASGLRVILQISDSAPLVGQDELNWWRAEAACLCSMQLTVGSCPITIVPPPGQFKLVVSPTLRPCSLVVLLPRGIRTSLMLST